MVRVIRSMSAFTASVLLAILCVACEVEERPASPPASAPVEDAPIIAPVTPASAPASAPAQTRPVPEAYAQNGIEIGVVSDREQLLPGPWAQADFGDWRIANDEFEVIIAGLDADPEQRPSMGIIDIARKADPYDDLSQIEPIFYIGDNAEALTLNDVAILREDTPALTFSGAATNNKNIQATLTYELDSDPRVLRLTTTLTNASTETLHNVALGERVQWGVYVPFIEGFGLPDPALVEVTRSSWVGGWIDNNSLGIVAREGMIEATHTMSVTLNRYENMHAMKPGDQLSVTRNLFIGDKDFSNFTDYALQLRETPTTDVTGRVLELESNQPVANAPIRVETYLKSSLPAADPNELPVPLPYTLTQTDSNGVFRFNAPVGMRVYPQLHDPTREGPTGALIYEAMAGQTLDVGEIRTKAQTRLALDVVDDATSKSLPCKIQINHVSGPIANYGPPFQAQGYRNNYYLPSGKETIPTPFTGSYEVVVSRGPEYSVEKFPLLPESGKTIAKTVRLKRVVDTKGYIAIDPGVLSDASYNSRITPRDMAIAAAGEGVEWLVSADVNKATDLSPAVKDAGLSDWLGTTVGMKPMPHGQNFGADFTVFPLDPNSVGARFDAKYLDEKPTDVLAGLRKEFPQSLLMVNAPMETVGGYLREFGFTNETIRSRNPDFNYDFDLFGMLDGRKFYYRDSAFKAFNRLALLGNYYTPAGASSSQELFGNEPGYPRMYVGVPDDDPAKVTEEQIIEGLRKGDVVVSNGPFIRFTCQGKRPGDLVTAKNGKLLIEVEAWAAPWLSINEVRIDKDSQFFRWFMRPPTEDPLRFPLKANAEFNPIQIDVKSDVTLQVRVTGNAGPMTVASSIEGRKSTDFRCFAITGLMYVDGDGDGKFSPPPDGKPRF